MTSTSSETPTADVACDPAVLQATDVALKALQEITVLETIGAHSGHTAHSDVLATLFFECLLSGYPGWRWAATLAKISPDDPVTVLEVGLLPGDGALVAPEWVPWAERLAAYREAREKGGESTEGENAATGLDDDADDDIELDDAEVDDTDLDDDDVDDLLDNDFSDFDVDLDGVDIDALADDPDAQVSSDTASEEEEA